MLEIIIFFIAYFIIIAKQENDERKESERLYQLARKRSEEYRQRQRDALDLQETENYIRKNSKKIYRIK